MPQSQVMGRGICHPEEPNQCARIASKSNEMAVTVMEIETISHGKSPVVLRKYLFRAASGAQKAAVAQSCTLQVDCQSCNTRRLCP